MSIGCYAGAVTEWLCDVDQHTGAQMAYLPGAPYGEQERSIIRSRVIVCLHRVRQ
jgi:hypothetical protein